MSRNSRLIIYSLIVTFGFSASGTACWAMQGTPASEDDVAAKSIVFIDVANGENCSGVVYRKNEVITAAHCVVEDGNKTVSPKRIKIYYTRNYAEGHDTFRNVTEVIVYPGFELGEKDGSFRLAQPSSVDIAILKLSDAHPVGAVDAMIEKSVATGKFGRGWHFSWSHSRIAAYGFGRTHGKDIFVLRTGEMIVDSESDKLRIIDGRPLLTGIFIRRSRKTALCYGDSGGGIFFVKRKNRGPALKNGKPILAGIVMSTPSKKQCSTDSRMISLGQYVGWIERQ